MFKTIQTSSISLAVAIAAAASPAIAQTPAPSPSPAADTPLSERTSLVGVCRSSGQGALPVFTSTALSQKVGDINPFTRLTLTGVLGQGIVQIRTPMMGWVRTGTLLTNCDAKPGTGTTKPPTGTTPPTGSIAPKACFIVAAPDGLAARETPNGAMQTSKGGNDGPSSGSKVFATDPVEQQTVGDRRWLKVSYTSIAGTERMGWIAEGRVNAGSNLRNCP